MLIDLMTSVYTMRNRRSFFLLGMRICFGLWLLYAGLMKWVMMGPHTFIGFIVAEFDKTWSPHVLHVALAWFIIVAEPKANPFS